MEEQDEILERIQRKHSSWGDKNFSDYSAMETLGDVARLLEGRFIPDNEGFEGLIRSLQECDQYKHSFADALGQSSSSFDMNSKKKRKIPINEKKGTSDDDEMPGVGGMPVQKKSSNKHPSLQPGTILANFGLPESSVSKSQEGNERTGDIPTEGKDNTANGFTNDTRVHEEPPAMDVTVNKDSEKMFTFFDQIRKRYGDESRIIVQIFMDIIGKYVARKIDYLACASMLQYLFRENPRLVAQSLDISDIDYYVDSNGSILTLSSKDGQHVSSYLQKSAVSVHNSQLASCRKRIIGRLTSDPQYREDFLAAQAANAAANAVAHSTYSYSSSLSHSSALPNRPYASYIPPRTGPIVIPKIIQPNIGTSSNTTNAKFGMNSQFIKPNTGAAAVVPPKPFVPKPVVYNPIVLVPEPVVPEDFREYLLAVKEAVSKEIYHKFLDSMIAIRNNFKNKSTTSRLQYESIRVTKGMIPEKVKHLRRYLDKFLIEE